MPNVAEAENAESLLLNGAAWAGKCYLNSAAEGLPLRAAAEAVQRYLNDKSTGEPGRVPMWATHARCRELAGRLFSVTPEQTALVSSTTEALNTIAQGIRWRPGDEVVFTSVEFPSNMCPWVVLTDKGVATKIVRPRDGLVEIDDLLAAVTPKTRLVTVSQVSYATGQHLDVAALWERLRGTDTLLCVDATQASGRVPVRGDQADFCVASTFKWLNSIHGAAILTAGPRALAQGVAGPAGWFSAESCYADDRLERFHPRGDAGRYHAGMPNFDSVYALAAALEYHTAERVAARRTTLAPLVAQLRDGLNARGLPVLTPEKAADRAGIVAFGCPTAEQAKRQLAEQGIFVHGDDGRLRAAVHWYNTAANIDRYLTALRQLLR
ncbi:MAG: aminotransferase class V-fold PLP-dependent enzyme [Pirellulales bacterium]